ncbi:MAG TPA: S53 family peptidase [Pseudonocardiaceae bacterium]|nr:S53 family peptidase [Pseudonocardiaceae bacterium]
MRKPLRIIAAVVAPVPIAAGIVFAATANATGTGAAPMVAVPHNVNAAVAGSTRTGDLAPNHPMSLAVSLKPHDEAGLHRFLAQVGDRSSPLYHHYLTPTQFTARYGPSTQDVAKVTGYLRSAGLTVTHVSGNRQVVDATGTAATVDKAFATRIATYRQGTKSFYANASAPSLPSDVAGVVAGISGLDNHATRHSAAVPNQKVGKHPLAVAGLTPAQLRTAYHTSSLGDGKGQTVALWEFDGYQASNIAGYDNQFGLKAPAPQTVSVDGANYDASPGQGQGEVELDVELVQAMAPAANTLVYEAPNSDQGQVDMANQIVTDDRVSVTSVSWGECETAASQASITGTDNALQQGAAEGISFFVASGDSGSDDCRTGGTAVDYPASDPNVSGAGGTSLTTDASGGYGSETAWSGSGGGDSAVFGTPAYQNDPSGRRAVPDVSLDADPNTGYAIFSAGQWLEFGGTSCAAPMWAGFAALYDAKSVGRLGNGNQAFYSIASGPAGGSAFHDITSGSNGAFDAGAGYDAVTGLGSYDGAGLAAALGGG